MQTLPLWVTVPGTVLLTSMLCSAAIAGRPTFHELIIVLLLLVTTPVTSIVMLQAAVYRNRARLSHDPPAAAAPTGHST